ncbi:MAG: hypothetical protein R2939_22370 [Kofleriaceae bacterium]
MSSMLLDLPLRERPAEDLLGLVDLERDHVDTDYTEVGWARVPTIWLSSPSAPARRVDDAVVLALHAADDGPAHPTDVLLEFVLAEGPTSPTVTVWLSAVLDVWLPRP